MPARLPATRTGSSALASVARWWRTPMRRRRSASSIVGRAGIDAEDIRRRPADCASIRCLDQQAMPSSPKRVGGLALWLNLGIVYTVWGSTYFGIAIAIETMPPFLMAAIRFATAGLILVTFDLVRHPEARRLPTARQ